MDDDAIIRTLADPYAGDAATAVAARAAGPAHVRAACERLRSHAADLRLRLGAVNAQLEQLRAEYPGIDLPRL